MPNLAALVRAKFPGAYDDLPDADLEAQVLAKHPEYKDLASTKPVAASEPDTFLGGAVKGLTDYAGDVGSRIGHAFVQSFNVPSMLANKEAADTKASGDLHRMLDTGHADPREPWTMGTLKTMGQNTVDQAPEIAGGLAAGYVTGKVAQGVGSGLKAVAPKVMDAGLWRSGTQRMEFPNTPQRLVDEGILPTSGRVQTALTNTENAVNQTAAQQAGPWSRRVLPSQMADQAEQFALQTGKVGGLGDQPGAEVADIGRQKASYLAQNTRARDLPETIAQKRAYQARTSYNPRPNAPVQTDEAMNFNKGIAGANREAAIRMDPSLDGLLSKEQDLVGAKQALGYTEARGTPLTAGGIARHTLLLPAPLGGAAIGMDRFGQMLASPNLRRLALIAALSGQTTQ